MPADSAGEIAVIEVLLFTVKEVAAVLPKVTALAFVKFNPVIVTLVPPSKGPSMGETWFTAGVRSTTETAVLPEMESSDAVIVMGAEVSELPAVAKPSELILTKFVLEEVHVTREVTSAVVLSKK